MKQDTRKLRREQGLCARCGKPSESYRCEECRKKRASASRDEYKQRAASGVCPTCGNPVTGKVSCEVCLERKRNEAASRKTTVITHYGNRCECCGIDNHVYLNIDHIEGNGNKHRAEIANHKGKKPHAHSKLYSWIIRNNFPDGFRVLCFGCNWATFLCRICAHKDPKALRLSEMTLEKINTLKEEDIPLPFFKRDLPDYPERPAASGPDCLL